MGEDVQNGAHSGTLQAPSRQIRHEEVVPEMPPQYTPRPLDAGTETGLGLIVGSQVPVSQRLGSQPNRG